ncbi:ATP-binding cassette domain-containing protein [Candidatus Dependentiae bacterium]|nr:ATP-binding cassette domain-containing protein [Candidatus Dependentiae bacterium]
MEEEKILSFEDCSLKDIITTKLNFSVKDKDSVMIIFPGDNYRNAFLDLVYGFQKPNEGRIIFKNTEYDYEYSKLQSLRRKISLISLEGNLISNLDVYENLRLPLLAMAELKTKDIPKIIDNFVEKLGIREFLDKLPHTISDLDRVKVNIVRGLCQDAQLFILNNLFERLNEKKCKTLFKTIIPELPCTIALSKSERGIKICNRVIILEEEGIIYNGSTENFGKYRSKKK